jgi:hypothetical protein
MLLRGLSIRGLPVMVDELSLASQVGRVCGITQCLHFPIPATVGAAPVQEPVTESLEPARWKFPSQLSRSFISASSRLSATWDRMSSASCLICLSRTPA